MGVITYKEIIIRRNGDISLKTQLIFFIPNNFAGIFKGSLQGCLGQAKDHRSCYLDRT